MFLGFARGKVGDVVFTRSDGEQLSRVRNRSPKNPRTPRQGVQRSILKTVSQAYSVLKPIADHSFEGYATGTPNQSRFAQLNNDLLRTKVVNNVNLSDDESILGATVSNYSPHLLSRPVLNPYMVSEGSLPIMRYRVVAASGTLQLVYANTPPTGDITYAGLVQALGAERGDQLTFVFVYVEDGNPDTLGVITGVEFSRVILEPGGGDMSTKFISVNNTVNDANPANSGQIWFDQGEVGFLDFGRKAGSNVESDSERTVGAVAVILSRKFGSVWRRSSQSLLVTTNVIDINHERAWPLGDAVRSFLNPEAGSSLYLNQAQPVVAP